MFNSYVTDCQRAYRMINLASANMSVYTVLSFWLFSILRRHIHDIRVAMMVTLSLLYISWIISAGISGAHCLDSHYQYYVYVDSCLVNWCANRYWYYTIMCNSHSMHWSMMQSFGWPHIGCGRLLSPINPKEWSPKSATGFHFHEFRRWWFDVNSWFHFSNVMNLWKWCLMFSSRSLGLSECNCFAYAVCAPSQA